jgi:polyhydroxyalkanoate synthesis regulator phasin
VKNARSLFTELKDRGGAVLAQVSSELMESPHFAKAVEGAMRGKQRLDQAVGRVLKNMNIPTRTEFKRALGRIEALEREVADIKAKAGTRARRPTPPRGTKKR